MVNAAIGSTSWALPLRAAQWVFAVLVMSLAAYTLDSFTSWKEIRFTVAAGAWAVLSLLWILTSGMMHRPKTHHYVILALEFINWAMFLAIWIALSVNIGKHQECAATLDSGHSHSRPCNTAYTAIAFAIVDWILFTVTFVMVGLAISNGDTQTVNEKNTGAAGVPIRASDDGTLRGEANA